MGMGYAGNFADVIEQGFVKEQCPQEFENFIQALADKDVSLEEFAQECRDYSEKEEQSEYFKAYQILCEAFNKITGLELYLDFHHPDEGDRYDDIFGVMWCVDGVYQLTKAGKKYQEQIERKFWVSFG
jgi:hypothetical protein